MPPAQVPPHGDPPPPPGDDPTAAAKTAVRDRILTTAVKDAWNHVVTTSFACAAFACALAYFNCQSEICHNLNILCPGIRPAHPGDNLTDTRFLRRGSGGYTG